MKKSKFKSIMLMCLTCTVIAFTSNGLLNSKSPAKFWVGVTYAMSEKGYSNKDVAGVGVLGVFHGAMEGVIWGSAFGGPAGAAAGIVAGL